MPRWIRTRWLVYWLFAALAFAGCAADTSNTGGLTIELELSDGTQIEEVTYSIIGGEMAPMVGTINTSAPGSTASVEIYGIPGGGPYTIMMTATAADGETSCSGSANFDVSVGLVTEVAVMLNCKRGQELGGVRVNGKLNICTDLVKVVVSPLQTSIGNQIDVFAMAVDTEGDPIEYRWTGTGGSFADASARETTYTCLQPGEQTITITVSDDGFDYCTCDHTVDVVCVDGGGTGGTGGSAGEGGMGGSAGEGGMGGSAGAGGTGGMAGEGGTGGMAGEGGTGGTAGEGGMGGSAGTGGMAGAGGMGGMAGAGGMGGEGGTGGTGGSGECIPDGGAQFAGLATNRICGEVTCGAMQVCVDQVCTPSGLIFVSSTASDAALGGPRGADQTCAALAEAAGLGGYWMSWTSDPCTSPFKRFEKSTLPYRMLDGVSIASSWDRLTNRPADEFNLENEFNMDEYGDFPGPIGAAPGTVCPASITTPPGCTVWTNTNLEGRVAALANNNGCLGLTSNDSRNAPSDVGQMTGRGRVWTEGLSRDCGIDGGRLFCFEQSVADPIP
jgi:hypothetical protein